MHALTNLSKVRKTPQRNPVQELEVELKPKPKLKLKLKLKLQMSLSEAEGGAEIRGMSVVFRQSSCVLSAEGYRGGRSLSCTSCASLLWPWLTLHETCGFLRRITRGTGPGACTL